MHSSNSDNHSWSVLDGAQEKQRKEGIVYEKVAGIRDSLGDIDPQNKEG